MRRALSRRAFTLVELLVVIGLIAGLIAILLPSLAAARRAGAQTKCLSNLRGMAMAQMLFAAQKTNRLVEAGDGVAQGSWIGQLEEFAGTPLVRRCPSDRSAFFDAPYAAGPPVRFRLTSYAINNYVSPTHAPPGVDPLRYITQVKRSSEVIQFVELAESGPYAAADHVHVQDFYFPLIPDLTLTRVSGQMPVGRHGGRRAGWDGRLNFSFLDGHAENLPLRDVYTDPTRNRFNPAATP